MAISKNCLIISLMAVFLGAFGVLFFTGIPLLGAEDAGAKKAESKEKAKPAQIKPRFEVKERDWPGQYGEASVCLWKNDALAVLSFTIDDNCAPDHPWWLEMGEKYNLRFTWCVITRRITLGNNSFNGTWEGWQKIHAAGHDVQSHTALHGHIEDPEWKDIEAEYANSQKEIEMHMPGNKCLVVGYFGGANSYLNDPAIAAKYYIGGRGGSDILNTANQIDYMLIHTVGLNIGDAQFPSHDIKNIFEKGKGQLAKFYRGWCNVNFHLVSWENRDVYEKKFSIVKGLVQENKLWVALLREGCQYGQERDTAQLKIIERNPGKIVFNLTDAVNDAQFDFPLTVKVRLDPSWKSVKAAQNSKGIEAKLIEHEGAVSTLVQAIPDRGDVILEKGSK